jgi:hypothetical protein
MSLATTIVDGVSKAKASLGDLVVKGTLLQKVSSSYNTSTGVKTTTTKSLDFDFVYEVITVDEIRDLQLLSTDKKLIMLDVPAIPTNQDIVKVGDDTFSVIKAYPVNAGEVTAICTVFIRK